MNYIRTTVSENRKRYIDKTVNLDLSYITDSIIAMAYPSGGIEGLYRNPYAQVKKFLENKHSSHYKVYNLRREKQYDISRFPNAANFPFDDHQAPPFDMLIEFCNDAADWLKADKENVVAIHCKAGKGRTGTVIAALLLHLEIARDAEQAMKIYSDRRTDDSKGVTIPSQRRYVEYYDFMLKNCQTYQNNKEHFSHMQQIVIHDISPSEKISCKIFDAKNDLIYTVKTDDSVVKCASNEILIDTTSMDPIRGDYKVVFTNEKDRPLFSFWFNTILEFIMHDNVVHLSKPEIDKSSKEYPSDISIVVILKS